MTSKNIYIYIKVHFVPSDFIPSWFPTLMPISIPLVLNRAGWPWQGFTKKGKITIFIKARGSISCEGSRRLESL